LISSSGAHCSSKNGAVGCRSICYAILPEQFQRVAETRRRLAQKVFLCASLCDLGYSHSKLLPHLDWAGFDPIWQSGDLTGLLSGRRNAGRTRRGVGCPRSPIAARWISPHPLWMGQRLVLCRIGSRRGIRTLQISMPSKNNGLGPERVCGQHLYLRHLALGQSSLREF
jgi:hypothetical protein